MGEYYDFVNLDKKEYLSPSPFGSGNKLFECTHVDDEFINCAYTLMNNEWKNDTVLFLGDESNLNSNGNCIIQKIIDKYGKNPIDDVWEEGVNISRLFKVVEKEMTGPNAIYYSENKLLEVNYINKVYKIKEYSREFIFFRYVINHTKGQYIDRNKLGDCGRIYYLDPFPMLIGVGRHSEYDYPNFRKSYMGMWIGDDIELTNNPDFKDYEDISHIEDKYVVITNHGVYDGYSLEAIKKEFKAYGYCYDEGQFNIGEYAFDDITVDENTFIYENSRKIYASSNVKKDNKKYAYVSVYYEDEATDRIYSYSPGGLDIKVGDRVWVYRKDELVVGKVGAIKQLTRYEAPCAPELLKKIHGFVDDDYVAKPYKEQLIDDMSPKERTFFDKWNVKPFDVIKHRRYNRDEIEISNKCGCYYCEKIYDVSEIEDWLIRDNGQTAICPCCGKTFVLGDASGYPTYDYEFIEDVSKYFF